MMKKYEIGIVIKASLTDAERKTLLDKISERISSFEGSIFFTDEWGVRELAYNIDGEEKGFYTFWSIDFPSSSVGELTKLLNLENNLLRFLIVNLPDNIEPIAYEGKMEIVTERSFENNGEMLAEDDKKSNKVEKTETKEETKENEKTETTQKPKSIDDINTEIDKA